MRLYLVRHADAVPKAQNPQRPLSKHGLGEVRLMAQVLSAIYVSVDEVWHSPKARSKQTAELLMAAIRCRRGLLERDDINPNSPLRKVLRDIRRAGGDVMIVGHEPHLGRLASQLLTGTKGAQTVEMVKAGVVCLQTISPRMWQVAWAITPQLMGIILGRTTT